MIINVASAIGRGPTTLAAFDHALLQVGLGNFNLIRLSSVVPPGATIVQDKLVSPDEPGTWGDRLYVVYAEHRSDVVGTGSFAGVGWVQDESGKGLFVEHHGTTKKSVKNDIQTSLNAMCSTRPTFRPGPVKMSVVGATCEDLPICALSIATFSSIPWDLPTPG